jgi:hypothetical protein
MTSKQINVLLLAIGLSAGAITMWAILTFALPDTTETILLRTSNEFNRNCPVMIDPITRFDNTTISEDNTLIFKYTIVNSIKDSIDTSAMLSVTEPYILAKVKANSALSYLNNKKVTLQFIYRNKYGKQIMQIRVAPDKK